MTYDTWKKLSMRKKATWPAADKAYLNARETIMISIDAKLAAWIADNLVGQSSFTSDFEETIETALRIIKGELNAATIDELRALARRARD